MPSTLKTLFHPEFTRYPGSIPSVKGFFFFHLLTERMSFQQSCRTCSTSQAHNQHPENGTEDAYHRQFGAGTDGSVADLTGPEASTTGIKPAMNAKEARYDRTGRLTLEPSIAAASTCNPEQFFSANSTINSGVLTQQTYQRITIFCAIDILKPVAQQEGPKYRRVVGLPPAAEWLSPTCRTRIG